MKKYKKLQSIILILLLMVGIVINNKEVLADDKESQIIDLLSVNDDITPIITTNNEKVKLEVGSLLPTTWDELFGLTAIDNIDGDITKNVDYDIKTSDIDMNILATYIITAIVTDSSNNTISKELIFVVEDTIAPSIIVISEEIKIEIGSLNLISWTELFEVIAIDNVDGDVTGNVYYDIEINDIDMNKSATYVITVTAADSSNNIRVRELKLVIEDVDNNIEKIVNKDGNIEQLSPKTNDINNILLLIIVCITSLSLLMISFKKTI